MPAIMFCRTYLSNHATLLRSEAIEPIFDIQSPDQTDTVFPLHPSIIDGQYWSGWANK